MQTKYHLKDLETLTPYQILSISKKHMLKQNEQSKNVSDSGRCKYHMQRKDGTVLMCGVGIFIHDDEYSKKLEGKDVVQLARALGVKLNHRKELVLHRIQQIHDCRMPLYWNSELVQLRKDIKDIP